VVIGAGVGGLAAAAALAARGLAVEVVERAAAPGGKMRELAVGGARLDAGPTVFTMRWVFDELFAAAGAALSDHLTLRPVETLARHAWSERERLDLFADVERSADAIGTFAGAAAARGFREFSARAARIYATLERPFIRAAQASPQALVAAVGLRRLGELWRITPFATLWDGLGEHFRDPRLRQLFGRYATYCGASPFAAPATLMLVAHVEREGVWLIEGGMHRIATALADLASAHGAVFRYGAEVVDLEIAGDRVAGVRLASGERLRAHAVVFNGDVAALGAGLLGREVAGLAPAAPVAARSLSALTWALVGRADGFPLLRHNVFFSGDYAAEFADLCAHRALPRAPTVYVCAQDRDDRDRSAPGVPERIFCLVNAPPTGDVRRFDPEEIEPCATRTFDHLARCGLRVAPEAMTVTTPADFARLFPATGGALYGRAPHGWRASFQRPGVRTRLPGFYLAGGSVHPGPGVPMAALSGRAAAACLVADLASTRRSSPVAMRGGTSMR
jgi:1-hydroxycarotenoid 3,4-desaturase